MNYRYLLRLLGGLLLVMAGALALTTLAEWLGFGRGRPDETLATLALAAATGAAAGLGAGLRFLGRGAKGHTLTRREALLLVAVGWLLGAGVAGLPYLLWAQGGGVAEVMTRYAAGGGAGGGAVAGSSASVPAHPFLNPVACYFEAMSGLTTTGATVLSAAPNDIESLPRGLLLWRAFTHWLGGLGIVVLFVAVLPAVGGGRRLFYTEAPGPKAQGVRPRIAETARVLWTIYLSLTLAQWLLLRFAGMPWFDGLCHTFATLGTGGFSTKNASMGHYHGSGWTDAVTIPFMVLAGVNFGLYYQLARGRFAAVSRDPELRLYLGLLTAGTLLIAAVTWGQTTTLTTGDAYAPGVVDAARDAGFQVASVVTTTGFATVDFDRWPFFAKAVLLGLLLVGGCAGSTGGGCKVVRVLVVAKALWAEAERTFRPNVVKPMRVGGAVVDADVVRAVLLYLITVALLVGTGGVALTLLQPAGTLDAVTALTASLTTLMNVGPGFGGVGAVQNYGFFATPSLAVLSLWMCLGRLEVFALLVLIFPKFWTGR